MLCWCSIDTVLILCWRSFVGEETTTSTILPIKVANTSIMGNSHSITLKVNNMQHPKKLTLCWHCVDSQLTLCWRSFWGVATLTSTIVSIQEANTSIMSKSHSNTLGLYMMYYLQLLTLCWCFLLEWCCNHVAFFLHIEATYKLCIDHSKQIASVWTFLPD